MFEVRKIQEQIIFEAVRKQSEAGTAGEIVYGKAGTAKGETNADWVKSTMCRLEDKF